MKVLNTSYHNINFNISLPKNNDEIINSINKTIDCLPALNIVKNKKLLESTNLEILNFQKNKKTFLIFGTGGSNLGARALTNIIQGKEDKKIYFYDNIDPLSFKNSINKIDLSFAGFIFISDVYC